jgi:NADPH-dependent ferric siderophore reductase
MRPDHVITRVRHPVRFRRVAVRRVETLTPKMRRIVVGGDDLEGFSSLGFDDHVKVFFPDTGGRLVDGVAGDNGIVFPEGARPEARDFTPRRYDPARRELTLDFSLHGRGPAATWAAAAHPGAPLGVGGPRGSQVVSDTFDWHLLVGDETALPAIQRRLEELPERATALVVVEVDDAREEQRTESRASIDVRWVHRDRHQSVDGAVADLTFPAGEGFAWVAGEASMARRVRQHLIQERGLAKAWIKAAAYWRLGSVGKHEVFVV